MAAYSQKAPEGDNAASKFKKVIDTIRLETQFMEVVIPTPADRARKGKISELMVHGMGLRRHMNTHNVQGRKHRHMEGHIQT